MVPTGSVSMAFSLPSKTACETNGIHEGTKMGLFTLFMKQTTGTALDARTCLSRSSCARQEGNLTSYCEAVNYLLPTYLTDDIIAEADMDVINFKQPPDNTQSNTAKHSARMPYAAGLSTKNIASRENSLKV